MACVAFTTSTPRPSPRSTSSPSPVESGCRASSRRSPENFGRAFEALRADHERRPHKLWPSPAERTDSCTVGRNTRQNRDRHRYLMKVLVRLRREEVDRKLLKGVLNAKERNERRRAHDDVGRGALARIAVPDRCNARRTAPWDSPNFSSISAIVAPALYSRAISAAVSSPTFRIFTTTLFSRSNRMTADADTLYRAARVRALSPACARHTNSSTFAEPRRFESSCGRYAAGSVGLPPLSPGIASLRS